MRIAIVHDFLNQFGGAERVVAAMHEIWPDAPIYTSIYDKNKMPKSFQQMDIRVSFMQKLPFVFQFFKYYLLFYPLAFEGFDLAEYDVILSSSSAFAKGIKKQPDQLHICYCYTPMRFVWRYDDYVKRESFSPIIKAILPVLTSVLKKWDLDSTQGVDYFIAISKTIQDRIGLTYGRGSDIIYPPVSTKKYQMSPVVQDYFLIVSRLNAYKRLDLVVEAFNDLELPLKIIGSGPALKGLKRIAKQNIEFLGRQPDSAVAKYYAQCRALIFPGEEDFGIVPVEAMAAGRPVIAFRAGGATETILEGKTGLFFDRQSSASLKEAVEKFQFEIFDKQSIRQQAMIFDKEIFKQKMQAFVESKEKER